MSQKEETVPRIGLQAIPRDIRISDIYSALKKFGVITYIGLTNKNAVVEFADRISVGKILARHSVKIKTYNVCTSQGPEWQQFANLVKVQQTFSLDVDVKAVLQNPAVFNAEVSRLVRTADQLTLHLDDNPYERDASIPRHIACRALEAVLAEEFTDNVRVYTFGSRASGTALETSDMDLFVDCDNTFTGEIVQNADVQAMLVQKVRRILAKLCLEFAHVVGVPRARMPIVRFLHCPSDTRCDAAFRNGLGCRIARLLRFILSLDDRIRPLLLCLKHWAYTIDLQPQNSRTRGNHRPQLTSHALAMLTVTYLQTCEPSILPPIKKIKDAADYSFIVAGWETAFCENRERFHVTAAGDRRSVRDLFLGFVQHFQEIDWKRLAASPLDGAYVQRHSLPSIIPTESAVMVVLDPINLSRNLTLNVSDATLCRLSAVCALSEREITSC